ncbi:MAG: selenocysteine-specific translation elongation factor [Bryobacteraceae bacterium]
MKNIIVGTAGHIDHGKTALVRALTGIETDRLKEEKRRGISIDLGFAHLDLDDGQRLGFVDVPGHERFVRNMLAGAAGIDIVLLVIAADESIKPQTREHFEICRLLGVRQGLIALTKADLVDPDLLGLVRLEAEEFVARSFLEGAPVVAVSAVTGLGLDELKLQLAACASRAAARSDNLHLRLPIDRAFSMKGFGTVVTGTLVAGSVGVDEEVEALPCGRRLRVRGLQVHGEQVGRARAGQRTALNLGGVEAHELSRGTMLVEPGVLRSTTMIDCRFRLLPSARPLKHGAPGHFPAWTSEIEAQVRLLDSSAAMKPGREAFLRLMLREPAALLPGDHFIVRMFSPVVTIGGGTVIDVAPPPRLRRAAALARVSALAGGDAARGIALRTAESRYGVAAGDLVWRTGLRAEDIEKHAALVLRVPQAWLIDPAWMAAASGKLEAAVSAFHAANPLQPGMPKTDLGSRELPGAPAFLLDAVLSRLPALSVEGELVRLASHRLRFQEDEEAAMGRIESAFESAGLAVPAQAEVLAACGVETSRARALLQILLRERKLVRVSAELVFHRRAVELLRALLAQRKGERFGVGAFKEWTCVSRKYAIPLLEYCDRERLTRREGDTRIVL